MDQRTAVEILSAIVAIAIPYLSFHDKLVTMMADLKTIKNEVGDNDSGMRKEVRRHDTDLRDHETRIQFLEEK